MSEQTFNIFAHRFTHRLQVLANNLPLIEIYPDYNACKFGLTQSEVSQYICEHSGYYIAKVDTANADVRLSPSYHYEIGKFTDDLTTFTGKLIAVLYFGSFKECADKLQDFRKLEKLPITFNPNLDEVYRSSIIQDCAKELANPEVSADWVEETNSKNTELSPNYRLSIEEVLEAWLAKEPVRGRSKDSDHWQTITIGQQLYGDWVYEYEVSRKDQHIVDAWIKYESLDDSFNVDTVTCIDFNKDYKRFKAGFEAGVQHSKND